MVSSVSSVSSELNSVNSFYWIYLVFSIYLFSSCYQNVDNMCIEAHLSVFSDKVFNGDTSNSSCYTKSYIQLIQRIQIQTQRALKESGSRISWFHCLLSSSSLSLSLSLTLLSSLSLSLLSSLSLFVSVTPLHSGKLVVVVVVVFGAVGANAGAPWSNIYLFSINLVEYVDAKHSVSIFLCDTYSKFKRFKFEFFNENLRKLKLNFGSKLKYCIRIIIRFPASLSKSATTIRVPVISASASVSVIQLPTICVVILPITTLHLVKGDNTFYYTFIYTFYYFSYL